MTTQRNRIESGTFQVFSLSKIDTQPRAYRRRQAHIKSYSGCVACRAKRVKCDELRPICARCTRNDRYCVYEPSKTESFSCNAPSSLTLKAHTLDDSQCSRNGTSSTHLMHHLVQNWTAIFNIYGRYEILALCESHSLIRSIVLSISASHLRHMSPVAVKHRVAEYFQQKLALQQYQCMLTGQLDLLDQETVNLLLLSAVLLNMLAFALPGDATSTEYSLDPYSSWVFSTHKNRLGWLALQEGIRHLLRSTTQYMGPAVAFLGRIFIGPDQDPLAYRSTGEDAVAIPREWISFFAPELKDNKHSANDPNEASELPRRQVFNVARAAQREAILPPLATLSQMVRVPLVSSNVFHSLSFLMKVNTGFRALLAKRDEKAMWVMGYWLGTMCRYDDLWWCKERVRRDYEAIRKWFELAQVCVRPGVEGQIWRQMVVELEKAALISNT